MAKDDSLLGKLTGFTGSKSRKGSDDLALIPDEDTIDDDLFPNEKSELSLGLPMPGTQKASNKSDPDVTPNRESNFSREAGRFLDPDTGQFEPGSPPPDLDTNADRYRAKDGQFKSSPHDLFDEPEEVRTGSLEPEG